LLVAEGKPVRFVESMEAARKLVRTEKSALGKGGMDSKLQAARMVTDAGEAMVVADGRMEDVLVRLLDFELLGTLFVPAGGTKRTSRSRWIGSARPVGAVVVDDGAVLAVVKKNKSLLPAGIVGIQGTFEKGDLVAVVSGSGVEVARGLSNYSSAMVEQVKGKRTAEVREMLGEAAYDEVVHRDNLVINAS
jgi:glutamate 5-kinase